MAVRLKTPREHSRGPIEVQSGRFAARREGSSFSSWPQNPRGSAGGKRRGWVDGDWTDASALRKGG